MEMMDVGNILKLDITLQKLSTAVVAVYLWDLKTVKNKICDEFNSGSQDIEEIFDYVVEKVPLLGLPETLSEEIKNYVHIIGGLIFDFMEYITKNGLDVAFGMNICWAPYGRIDEVKMCRDFLKNSCEGQVLEDRFLCLARIYTDINLVRPHMTKIRKKFKKSKNRSLDIFQHCLENDDLYFATRYFWRELDIMEKQNIIVNCAQTFLRLVLQGIVTYQYLQQVNTELLVFFMGEMSEIQLSEFVTENYSGLFEAFLKSWPHQELCGNIIDLYYNVNDEDGSYMEQYFSSVLWMFSRYDYNFRIYKHKNVFHSILQNLLEKSPDELKQKYFSDKLRYPENIFTGLTQSEDWVALSTILNDGPLKKIKELVVYGYYRSEIDELLRHNVLRGNLIFVNNFLKYVVSTEDEIKSFKRKIDWVRRFASEGNIKAADRVLNWAFDTEQEKKERMEEIHPLEVGKFIIERRYDIADEFVNWWYDTEEERKDAKTMLYKLDPINPLKYCTGLFHKMEFKEIDQYLTWRYSEEEERKNIRKALHALEKNDPKEIVENLIDEFRIIECDYKDKIEKARFYLKLRFETEEERRDFKRRLYESEGYLLEKCHKVLIPMHLDRLINFDSSDYLNCFEMLKFFLETEEAVVEFETNNIFTKEFFLKHTSDMPFKSFKKFLHFRDKMRKAIDAEKKYMYEDVCYQFMPDRRTWSPY